MLSLICPECGAKNSLTAERCLECDASLTNVFPIDDLVSHPSEEDEFDLLNRTGDDLPDLLHALKQDEADSELSGDDQETSNLQLSEPEPEDDEADDAEDETEIPEWLNRVRQRASQETDSVGEITQKISAALESLAEGKNEDQHDDFESWIHSLKDSPQDKKYEQGSKDADQPVESNSDWLAKIRKAQGKFPVDESKDLSSNQDADSLLQWLVALEDKTKESTESPEVADEAAELEADDTQEMPVLSEKRGDALQAITPEDTEPVILEPPKLTVSREEKVQADQLSATIVDERASRPVRKTKKTPSHRIVRLVIAIFLIAGLSLSLFIGQRADLSQGNLHSHNAAMLAWAEDLPEDAALLIIFDYHPGYASELSLIAKPILEKAISDNHKVSVLSSTASGVLLSQQLLKEIAGRDTLSIEDMGYFPMAAYGAYGALNWRDSDWEIRDYPVPDKSLPNVDYDGVLILSDSFEGARIWIEQLSIIIPDAPLNLLVTAQAGPLLLPYWESGQVSGLISGLPEAAGVEAALANDFGVAVRWRAYQTGLLMLIALMTIGVIYGVDQPSDSTKRGAL